MKRTVLLLHLALLFIFPASAISQSAPDGFRDLKWGDTREKAQSLFRSAQCRDESSPLADWRCVLQGERVNDVTVMVILLGYAAGTAPGFQGFSLAFKSDQVRPIVEAFEARYGKANTIETKDFLTKGGGKFQSTEWRWEFPEAMARIHEQSGRLGNAMATVSSRASQSEFSTRRSSEKREAGKGL
jgi:hypothetical protein